MKINEFKNIKANPMLNETTVIPETADLETIAGMLDAAKRGLGLANQLRDLNQRKRHVRAVFINLNKIRAALSRYLEIDNEVI